MKLVVPQNGKLLKWANVSGNEEKCNEMAQGEWSMPVSVSKLEGKFWARWHIIQMVPTFSQNDEAISAIKRN